MNFVDPCSLLYFNFDSATRNFANNATHFVKYTFADPEIVLTFEAMDVVFDQGDDISGSEYCGKVEYDLT